MAKKETTTGYQLFQQKKQKLGLTKHKLAWYETATLEELINFENSVLHPTNTSPMLQEMNQNIYERYVLPRIIEIKGGSYQQTLL